MPSHTLFASFSHHPSHRKPAGQVVAHDVDEDDAGDEADDAGGGDEFDVGGHYTGTLVMMPRSQSAGPSLKNPAVTRCLNHKHHGRKFSGAKLISWRRAWC
jgi:hypothetical protein